MNKSLKFDLFVLSVSHVQQRQQQQHDLSLTFQDMIIKINRVKI